MTRRLLLLFALLALCAASLPLYAGDEANAKLIGTWRHVIMTRVIDGRALPPQPAVGEALMRMMADGTWSLTAPQITASGTYRWTGADRIETTTLESTLAVQVGMVSSKQVMFEEDRVALVTVSTRAELDKLMGPPKSGGQWPATTVITSIFRRVAP